ncbi:hypothetical protein GCM10023190_22660 [Enteractinococcus fodinae]|uniref:Uncharacterized protein n=1 Tax=Enteractinococcus fodinae TaxID=684663 RepID=A0ABU2B2Z5_9MICC|nr:hypothetical protein [Enteractinococcus fodinae]MDR7347975.1 hypothetical protein [Enteractinococcus fodinae]
MTIPQNETAQNVVIGADSDPNDEPGQHASVHTEDQQFEGPAGHRT